MPSILHNSGHTINEQQDAYAALSETEQSVLFAHHWDMAHQTERSMNWPKTIEIAGKKILAMPLEITALTPGQQEKFKWEANGFEIDCLQMNTDEQIQFAKDHPESPIDWQVSFKNRHSDVEGPYYNGFELFKKVYGAFPDVVSLTEEEATNAGFYPTIHYRNFAARKWMAEMNGGHLATLEDDHKGELRDIYNATKGENNLERLASMGQAPLGYRCDDFAEECRLGRWAILGSGSLDADGNVRTLNALRNEGIVYNNCYCQMDSASGVVVLDK